MTCEVIFMKHTSQKHLKSQYLAYANITRALFTYKNTFLIMSSQKAFSVSSLYYVIPLFHLIT